MERLIFRAVVQLKTVVQQNRTIIIIIKYVYIAQDREEAANALNMMGGQKVITFTNKDQVKRIGYLQLQIYIEVWLSLCCWAAQFEGALGRLTASSIHNPRQIINVHIAPGSESEDTRGVVEVKRFKEFLLHIEKVSTW